MKHLITVFGYSQIVGSSIPGAYQKWSLDQQAFSVIAEVKYSLPLHLQASQCIWVEGQFGWLNYYSLPLWRTSLICEWLADRVLEFVVVFPHSRRIPGILNKCFSFMTFKPIYIVFSLIDRCLG